MSERAGVMDDDTLRAGLLMESAQAHQRTAEAHLERLKAHTMDLDGVVREEIRRTLVDELQALTVESERAARALRQMKRAVTLRSMLWHVGMLVLCTAIPGALAHYALPSSAEIEALRVRRDSLAQNLLHLEQRGGRVDWRSCGAARRLCARVERQEPAYGENADYLILKGY